MTTTPKGNIPLIDPSATWGYLKFNEAMYLIDALVFTGVIDRDLTAPPGSESEGDLYIPKAIATGDWADHEDDLAHYYNGSYHFYTPEEGWRIWVNDEDTIIVYNGSAWVDATP